MGKSKECECFGIRVWVFLSYYAILVVIQLSFVDGEDGSGHRD